ncbi:hypothetical protein SAMN05878482_107115 [Peribacillus simplex]|uniref:Uncharacterized protein n=1 Tax=Peribacillus simplex TaxID=1478 RepID=A0A9X8RCR5_9BACI|nr:hypothetical protein SAMN05878482_107115 [Peribacillus simplex]
MYSMCSPLTFNEITHLLQIMLQTNREIGNSSECIEVPTFHLPSVFLLLDSGFMPIKEHKCKKLN